MPEIRVLRKQPITPPTTGATITFSLEEVQELAGILGQGSGLVNGLYEKLSLADDHLTRQTPAYNEGMRWAQGR